MNTARSHLSYDPYLLKCLEIALLKTSSQLLSEYIYLNFTFCFWWKSGLRRVILRQLLSWNLIGYFLMSASLFLFEVTFSKINGRKKGSRIPAYAALASVKFYSHILVVKNINLSIKIIIQF